MVKNSKKKPIKAELAPKIPDGYKVVLELIVGKIKAAQTRAMVAVNCELIEVYRDIGETIYDQQQSAKWGSSVVEQLASDLQKKVSWNERFFISQFVDYERFLYLLS